MLSIAFLGGYLTNTAMLQLVAEESSKKEGMYATDDASLRLYAEALRHIEQKAVFSVPPKDLQEGDIVASSLKAFLSEKDPYSDFLTPQEYAKFSSPAAKGDAGIGLDIEKRRNGHIICYPVENGPAAAAGIQPGERLLAMNGVPVTGKSLAAVAALAKGEVGSSVMVEIENRSGEKRRLTLSRSRLTAPSVSTYRFSSASIVRLSSFLPDTRAQLDYLLSIWNKSSPIIIDLRSCGGGDFYAAVDSAMLFLRKGEPIVSVRKRQGETSYSSSISRPPPRQPVFLWQDEFTASAAEIFIAALTENGRATSVGQTTAGKGTRQDLIPLQNGGALILTIGYLVTPHGRQFDGKGLPPMHRVESSANGTQSFFEETMAITDK